MDVQVGRIGAVAFGPDEGRFVAVVPDGYLGSSGFHIFTCGRNRTGRVLRPWEEGVWTHRSYQRRILLRKSRPVSKNWAGPSLGRKRRPNCEIENSRQPAAAARSTLRDPPWEAGRIDGIQKLMKSEGAAATVAPVGGDGPMT